MIWNMYASRLLWVTGFSMCCALGVATGCGDDDDGGKTATGGTGGGATGGSGGTGGGAAGSGGGGTGGGTAGSAGSAGAGGGAGLTCDGYCTEIMANCKEANQQYSSKDVCLKVCANFPVGTESDTNGNTLGCRAYHTGAAKGTANDAVLHCPHAGPAGDDFCGSNCEGYCNIMVPVCTGEFAGGLNDCLTKCASLTKATSKYTIAQTTGDSVECRIYHASAAAEDPAGGSAAEHCPHAGITPTAFCQ